MTKKIEFFDPYAEQEKNKYDNPVPSRQSIIDYLTKIDKSLTLKQLIKATGVKDSSSQDALFFRLKAMLRDGQLMQDRRSRYCVMENLDLIDGKILSHPEGFGFVIPDEGGKDLFLSAKEMRQVMHGDRVKAFVVSSDRRSRREGKIHEVTKRVNTSVVGKLLSERGVYFVEPDNRRLTQSIAIAPEDIGKAKPDQIVLVELIAFPSKHRPALGRVIEILGDHMAPGLEIDVALHSHDIPSEWPQAVLDEVGNIPLSVSESEIQGRTDLRDLPFVTIDGEDARDFDDAVYCKRREKTWQLMVAIADVSHYVKPGSAIDTEAQFRSTSVYFPGRVIPMLPEQLSNGICSLNPNVDRLCLVCDMTISDDGKVKRSRFFQAAIHSKARLTYTKVANYIKNGSLEGAENVSSDISTLYNLFEVLFKQRKKRGALDFDTTETQIVFDEDKKISEIVPVIRNEAHRLIEECMLSANVCAANFVKREKLPALYRVHEAPGAEKIEKLREFLAGFALTLGGGKKPSPKQFAKTLSSFAEKAEKNLIETVMLRSLMQAKYIEKNEGHFGLAYAAYAHFTSPIRRYPDLLTHRAIVHAVEKKEVKDFYYTEKEIAALGVHASSCERRADEATREVVSWLKCEYMQDKVGEEYEGTISAVTSFGLFVMLDDIFVEGLIHITSLKGDRYQFDSTRHRLVGGNTNRQFRLGDKVHVQVARVDLDDRKMDFDLVGNND